MSDEGSYSVWIDSGSGGGYEDTRQGFSPAAIVFQVEQLLAASGVVVSPSPNQLYVASIAAADLLRALGVRPVIAPMR